MPRLAESKQQAGAVPSCEAAMAEMTSWHINYILFGSGPFPFFPPLLSEDMNHNIMLCLTGNSPAV